VRIATARNGAKRLKLIRHPCVLLVKDSLEIENGPELTIYIVTEAVTPLTEHLRDLPTSTDQARSISHRSPYDRVGVVNADP
jgi:SCY1-like protein 1